MVFPLSDPLPRPAVFNRGFVSTELDEDIVNTLLLGPSLIKKPNKLKKMIMKREDRGYAGR